MQAIEFEASIENGLIHLPKNLQHWQAVKHVKVIVLIDENIDVKDSQLQGSINRHAGKIQLSQDPMVFQQTIRDEWA